MKSTIISIAITAIIIGGAIMLASGGQGQSDILPGANVTVADGRQIVELRAKGGYLPGMSVAKAGMPTVVRFETRGTFDCSSSVRIPSMDVSRNLPPSGTTDIDLGSPEPGTLHGSCGMGMYPFEIVFEK